MAFIFCDIDGTIADSAHRLRSKSGKDLVITYDMLDEVFPDIDIEYYYRRENVLNDGCFENANFVLTGLKRKGFEIIYLTGRSLESKDATQEWLWKHSFPYGKVICCREKGFDTRTAFEVKSPVLEGMATVVNELGGAIIYEDDWDKSMIKGCAKLKGMKLRLVESKDHWFKEEKFLRKMRLI